MKVPNLESLICQEEDNNSRAEEYKVRQRLAEVYLILLGHLDSEIDSEILREMCNDESLYATIIVWYARLYGSPPLVVPTGGSVWFCYYDTQSMRDVIGNILAA